MEAVCSQWLVEIFEGLPFLLHATARVYTHSLLAYLCEIDCISISVEFFSCLQKGFHRVLEIRRQS